MPWPLHRCLFSRALAGLVFCLVAWATPALALDPNRALSDYRLDEWTPQQGLPYAAIRALQQDKEGYLWIGTRGGLGRFDGVHFTVFNSTTVPLLGDDEIFSLAEDADGVLWIATRNGVLCHDYGRWFRHPDLAELEKRVIKSVAPDRLGGMVIATEREVYRHRKGRLEKVNLRGITFSDTINGVFASRDGRGLLVLGQPSAWITDHEVVPITEINGVTLREVRSALEEPGGSWLITSTNGLFRFDQGHLTTVSELGGLGLEATRSIAMDRDQNLWIGTPNGVFRFRDGRMAPLMVRGDETLSNILCITEDREGNVWFGTDSGLVRLADVKFSNLTRRHGLSATSMLSVLPKRDGSLWIGTWGGGINILRNDRVEEILRKQDGLMEDAILSLAEAPDGAVWVGYYSHGLSRISGDRIETVGEQLGPNFRIQMMHHDRSGQLWLLCNQHGLLRLSEGQFQPMPLPRAPQPSVMFIDSRDQVWIGWAGGLGYLSAGNRAWTEVQRSEVREAYTAPAAVAEDHRGDLWIPRDGPGLLRVRNGEVRNVELPVSLGRLAYSALAAGDHLWLGFRNGVAAARLEEWDAWVEGRVSQPRFDFYNQTDGMRSAAPNAISAEASRVLPDGRIAFATSKGIALLDPDKLYPNRVEPATRVERVVVDKAEYRPERGPIRVRPDRKEVAFYFTSLSLTDSEQNQFRYRLVGVDADWIEAGHRREAHYGGLNPGVYRFEVRGSNNEALWSQHPAVVEFELLPQIYETVWMRVLIIAAILGVIAVIWIWRAQIHADNERRLLELVEWRTQDLKTAKEHAEDARNVAEAASRAKSDFVANMSHEIRTPMNGVIGMTELALNLARDAEQVTYLKRVLSSGESLMVVINDILDFSKIESGKFTLDPRPFVLTELIDSVLDTVAVRAERTGLELVADIDPRTPTEVVGDGPRLRQILLNLLGNSVKFTEKGSVELRVQRLEGSDVEARLQFTVSDTGIGIAPDRLAHIFRPFIQADNSMSRRFGGTGLGLTISQSLAQLMGGEINVRSDVGQGSDFSFVLSLPVTREASPPRFDPRRNAARIVGLPEKSAAILSRLLLERGWLLQQGPEPVPADAGPLWVFAGVCHKTPLESLKAWSTSATRLVALTPLELTEQRRSDLRALGVTNFLLPPLTRSRLADCLQAPVSGPLPSPVTEASPGTTPGGLRILVAEDTEVNQLLVMSLLAKAGHRADLAQNGAEAVDMYQKNNYDLVLMDVQMPGMDGFEATARIRELEASRQGPRVPIIAITAHAMNGYAELCATKGMDDYMAKPMRSARLREMIAKHCHVS